ncbi:MULTISPECIES: MerR family transcriptional regulator [unclassified Clostridium]|uniref:MerR family transcriptional regulator n=1 Tax=unclassified Clostridium TaxID=2614128 RepID=UPI00029851B3|nr:MULTISPECIES: MerR family transcriptional regulator [unclassified Clostridium]EKQ57119.1 MAG: putative transcriptional regulator [Clostridium sp. Maddingley MBC34-26]
MTITEVSKKYGMTQNTLRYYERIGIIPPVNRNQSGIRDYTEEDCRWVKFAKCMREAGMSIEVLVEYVELSQEGKSTYKARKELLFEERDKLKEKIAEMRETLIKMDRKIDYYEKSVSDLDEKI